MIGDYMAQLLHEERSARLRAEADTHRRIREALRRSPRSRSTAARAAGGARVPRQRGGPELATKAAHAAEEGGYRSLCGECAA